MKFWTKKKATKNVLEPLIELEGRLKAYGETKLENVQVAQYLKTEWEGLVQEAAKHKLTQKRIAELAKVSEAKVSRTLSKLK
jgi:DNA-directed RNA polymerase specialized sigma subunit